MNKLVYYAEALTLLIIGAPQISATSIDFRDTVSVADFGLKPDTRENATPYVQKALEACKSTNGSVLVFPKGRYDFWPQDCIKRNYFESNTTDVNPKNLAILIEGKQYLMVDGEYSDFVFHGMMQPITIDNSQYINLYNFTIDWDIPLTAQAEVTATTDEYMDLKINAYESPYLIENGKLIFIGEGWKSRWWGTMEFEKDSRIVAPQTGDYGCLRSNEDYRAEELSRGNVRLNCRYQRKPAVGNLLVLRHSERSHAGAFIIDSKTVRLKNINMYHNAGLGILSQYSEHLTFDNVNCIPDEQKGRILAGHDDGFHYSNCKGDIKVRNCTFHGLMDDPINVHGTSVRVIERVNDNTLRCKFMHSQSVGLKWARPGESIGFIENESMQTVDTGEADLFHPIDNEQFYLTFKQAVPAQIEVGDALENLTWTCNVLIEDSHFKSCRARGILISTPGQVRIENNIFESSGSAILIAGDANQWYESGAVHDVRITGNTFKSQCLTSMYQFCEGVISIYPEIPKKSDNAPFHRNIVISDNKFHLFDYPILYALSVDNIEFSNNKLIRSHDFTPWHPRKYGLTFESCKHILIKDNTMEGDILGNTVKLINTSPEELELSKLSPFKLAK